MTCIYKIYNLLNTSILVFYNNFIKLLSQIFFLKTKNLFDFRKLPIR